MTENQEEEDQPQGLNPFLRLLIMGFVLGILLFSMMYIGAYVSCKNGVGFLTGKLVNPFAWKCIKILDNIPVCEQDGELYIYENQDNFSIPPIRLRYD